MGRQLDNGPITRTKRKDYDYEEESPKYPKGATEPRMDSSKKGSYDGEISYAKAARDNQLKDSSPYEEFECEYLGVDDLDKLRRRSLDNV